MSRRGPFVAIDEPVAHYRRHDSNATSKLPELVRAQAAVRRRIWRHPDNTPTQRRAVARAWRYLRAREASLLVRQTLAGLRSRRYASASRNALAAVLTAAQTLLPGPPGVRLAMAELARDKTVGETARRNASA